MSQAPLARLVAEHYDPATYNSASPPAVLRFSPALEVMRQGTAWHGAGIAATARQHAAVAAARRAIYPEGIRLSERRVWQAIGLPCVFMEWRSEGTAWNGRVVRNGGLSVFDFADGAVVEIRVFTNTAYLEAVERGWEALLDLTLLLDLPAWHTLGMAPIAWRPGTPSRHILKAGDPLPPFGEPMTFAERAARALHVGISYFDVPEEHRLLVSPRGYTEFQGTRWYLAGHHGHQSIANPNSEHPVAIAQRILFTPPGGEPRAAMSHAATWGAVGAPNVALFEWISDRITCTGRAFRNHGATIITCDAQGRRLAHREYCNIAYLEAVHDEAEVRRKMGPAFQELEAAATFALASEDWQAAPIPEN